MTICYIARSNRKDCFYMWPIKLPSRQLLGSGEIYT